MLHLIAIKDYYIRRIWRPLVFCDDVWTVGPQPVLCAARRCAVCCWRAPRAVLL